VIVLRNAARQFVRRPGLSLVVILMLALGIGATTAIFSVFHQVLVQPLPVPEPQRLVNLAGPGPQWGPNTCSNAGTCDRVFSYPMYRDLAAGQSVFTGIAAHRDFYASVKSGQGPARTANGVQAKSINHMNRRCRKAPASCVRAMIHHARPCGVRFPS